MRLVNETGQEVHYDISATPGGGDCGNIAVDGYVDLPGYDNLTNVSVSFMSTTNEGCLVINLDNSGTGQQVEVALLAE